jgi:Janus/Ocnus family (Ocnus)
MKYSKVQTYSIFLQKLNHSGNVAQDLREWIEAAGYVATVTGGGRINYQISSTGEREVVFYGFSYGFGRGDHAKAAAIVKEWSQGGIATFVDDSLSLY